MTQGVTSTRLLPDPDLVSKAIAHRREQIQTSVDSMQAERRKQATESEPFTVRKLIGQLHPLFKSTIQTIV